MYKCHMWWAESPSIMCVSVTLHYVESTERERHPVSFVENVQTDLVVAASVLVLLAANIPTT